MKAAQNFYGFGNCLGSEQAGAKDAIAQAGDLAVFMNLAQAAPGKARDFQTNRVRSNIDRG